jgi:hypothetical protein
MALIAIHDLMFTRQREFGFGVPFGRVRRLLKFLIHRMARLTFLIRKLDAMCKSVAVGTFIVFVGSHLEVRGWI